MDQWINCADGLPAGRQAHAPLSQNQYTNTTGKYLLSFFISRSPSIVHYFSSNA
jgi:hypothetical protein